MSGTNSIIYFIQSATLSSLRVGIIDTIFFRFGSRRFFAGLFRRTTAVVVAFFETVFTHRHPKLLARLKHSRYFLGVGESSHTYRLDVRPAPLSLQWTNDLQLVRRVLLARYLQNNNVYYENKMIFPSFFLVSFKFLLFKI